MAFCAYCGTPVDAVSYTPCAVCGNPTNGSPKRAAADSGTSAAVTVAVIIGLLLAGFVIMGILAAIAVPNLLTAMQRSKEKRTMADMRTIASAVEAYASDNNKRYPDAISMDQLAQQLSPKYIQHLPVVDGWGNPMHYDCWSSTGSGGCDNYVIASAAKDGKFEEEDPSKYQGRGSTKKFDEDIVLKNGQFIQAPEGMGEP